MAVLAAYSILIPLLAMVAVMACAWAVVMRLGNGGWTDVFWTFGVGLSGIAAALLAGGTPIALRAWLSALLIGLWSLRLGGHLFLRVAGSTEDFRYARLRDDWGRAYRIKMLGFLMFQAVCAMPLVVAVSVAAARTNPGLDFADAIGLGIGLAALAGEAVSDRQLEAFKSSRSGGVLDTGLWGWSRHPNFFFEWLIWCGWPVIAIGPGLALWPGALALIAPVVMYYLLVHVTGIPPVERRMEASRGEAFRAYQQRVPVFFPWPPGWSTPRPAPNLE